MHFKKLHDRRFVGEWDLPEGGTDVTIDRLSREEVIDPGTKKKSEKPVLYFKNTKKGLVLNRTNAATIANLHGTETDGWVGQRIRLVRKKVQAFGDMVDAVRVEGCVPRMED